ncbi:MAG: type II secretion system F family protein [Nitrospirae bacterium]|nr:type II secretion system F family protein [Nitrospirota bacterium]
MSTYAYRARSRVGELIIGTLEADTQDQVEARLARDNLIPVRIEERRPKKLDAFLDRVFKRIKPRDRIVLYRQLAAMYGAGVSFTRMLETAKKQTENPRLQKVLVQVGKDIQEGMSFANALARHPGVFNEVVINMVSAGEAGGVLEEVLDRIGQMAERELDLDSKVRSATLYPKMVLVAAILGGGVVVYFLIPKLQALYRQLGGANAVLPLPTRILVGISDAFIAYWYLAAVVLGSAYASWRILLTLPAGRYLVDRLRLKVWIFGSIFERVAMARFSRIFGSLYRSGMPILQALEISSRALGNAFIAREVLHTRQSLIEGKTLLESIERAKGFTPMIQQMIGVGEEAGTLDRMLQKAADYYDSEIDHSIRTLTTLLEPALLLGLFAIVGFLALAMFLPMWQMISFVNTGGGAPGVP